MAPRGVHGSDTGKDDGARGSCPYVETVLQKSVTRRRSKEAFSQRQKGGNVNGDLSPRMIILAKHTPSMRVPVSQEEAPQRRSAPGDAGGEEKPNVGRAMCKVARPA